MKTARYFYRSLMLVMLVIAIVACAYNPFRQAQTVEEQAWVALKSYDGILRTQVLPAMKDENVPVEIRKALGDGNRVGTPAVVALERVIGEYTQIKAEVLSGHSTEEQLSIAAENLSSHTLALLSVMTEFRKQLKEAKP